MNILILSCGTRYKLVEYFKNCSNIEKVVGADCSELAPALLVADKGVIVPRMTEPGYLETILDICIKENINAILPLQEEELLLISREKKFFLEKGITPVISDYEAISLCKDKFLLYQKLCEEGIETVPTYTVSEYLAKGREGEEVFVKPRTGAGSVNTFSTKSLEFVKALAKEYESEELIVQPKISGKEFGVDTYIDLISKEPVTCFIKEKLRMRAGETEKSLSVKNESIKNLVINAVKKLGLAGPIDMDILEQDGKFYILEINPRFGGGYPHAYMCGVDFPKFIASNIEGTTNESCFDCYESGIIAMKYSETVTKNA